MRQPKYLSRGDSVTVISTARKIAKTEIRFFVEMLQSWGLLVKFGENLFAEYHQFAGTISQRAADLQNALDDESCKAVFCARGGYGTVQLMDGIDFEKFQKHPKWIVGYSDVTVLHNHINQNFGIETLHATMPINVTAKDEATETLRKALFGEELSFEFMHEEGSILPSTSLGAPIVGGNLSILYSLTGTKSQIDTTDKFLFIEDLDEYLYHIDRMMMNLNRAGLFDGCKGVLVGGMSDMNDNAIPYGQTAKEIILENTKELGIPIVFGVPAGHIPRNLSLLMNRNVTLTIAGKLAKLVFDGSTQ